MNPNFIRTFDDLKRVREEYMNTLVPLGNEALRQRHWDKIFAKLQRPYDKDMTLNMLVQWDVFSIKDFADKSTNFVRLKLDKAKEVIELDDNQALQVEFAIQICHRSSAEKREHSQV